MRGNIHYTALFVRLPFTIKDLLRPDQTKYMRPFVIEKIIDLALIDYENLITDMCVDRWFIEENRHLCYTERGIWHCLLVRRRGKKGGMLIMSEGTGFPKYAAYYPEELENVEYEPTGEADIRLL